MLTVDFDLLGVKKGDISLDAGCGFGRHSFEFARRGATVYSADIDEESLHKTRYMLFQLKKNGSIPGESSFIAVRSNALRLPFRDSSFDTIICSEVMEHVDDDNLACGELCRVLKKNGTIAITVPTRFSEIIYNLISFEYFSTPGGHIRIYKTKQLGDIMRKNGLEIYGIDYRHSFHTFYWMIKGVVGLHNNSHFLSKSYHKFLTMTLSSKYMKKAERFFDFFFPKSLVIYAWKK